MREIAEHILSTLEAGRSTVLVTVMDISGSTPRHAGTQMLVSANGLECGTIGGGAVEGHAIAQALGMVGQRLACMEDLGLTLQGENSLGMACGGAARLLYTPVCAGDAQWHEVAAGVLRCIDERISATLALRCCEGEAPFESGVALLGEAGNVVAGDSAAGSLSAGSNVAADGLDTDSRATAGNPIACDNATDNSADESTSHNSATANAPCAADLQEQRLVGEWLVLPAPVSVRAVVFGGGHVGRAVVAQLARVGFACTLFDSRPEFARPECAPAAQQVILGDYENIAASLTLDARDYVLIMTHSHKTDFAVLEQALSQPLAYVGCIGSRRKVALGYQLMREAGISEAALSALHAPIGLPIKAETPEEIAVSIAAECILHRATH